MRRQRNRSRRRNGLISLLLAGLFTGMPVLTQAQDLGGEVGSLHRVLGQLYAEMLPLCGQLIGVGRGIAGFAALWYIASRVWRHLANAEPVDVYPLLRPFAIGLAILVFPSVIALINGVLQPTVSATAGMVKDSNRAITGLLQQKEKAIQKTPAWQMYAGELGAGDREKWYRYTHPDVEEEGMLDGIGNDIKFAMAKASYNFRNAIKQWLSEILQLLFEAAALCLNTLRTFQLIVLAILGPLVFGLSVFDGFQHTLSIWLARYVNIFLWLPVANIFGSIIGKIQEQMLKLDISQVNQYGDTFFSVADTAYLVFLIIGIVGYLTVPSVANYIVHAGGGNALLYKVTNLFGGTGQSVVAASTGSLGALASGTASELNKGASPNGYADGSPSGSTGPSNGYQHDKLSGK